MRGLCCRDWPHAARTSPDIARRGRECDGNAAPGSLRLRLATHQHVTVPPEGQDNTGDQGNTIVPLYLMTFQSQNDVAQCTYSSEHLFRQCTRQADDCIRRER